MKSLRYAIGGRVDFTTSKMNLCGEDNDRYFLGLHSSLLPNYISILLSAIANEYEVRIVVSECEETDLGGAAEVKALTILRP